MDGNKFYRNFLIFGQEDAGFGAGGNPSGYVKMEVRDGKGKLHASVQNLKEAGDGFEYKMYLIKCDDRQVVPVCAGKIVPYKNKAEIFWEFSPGNVDMSGLPIQSFNVAAVIAEYKDGKGSEIVCPLAAYKNKGLQWKSKMKEKLYKPFNGKSAGEASTRKEHDIISKYNGSIESIYASTEKLPDKDGSKADSDSEEKKESIAENNIATGNYEEESRQDDQAGSGTSCSGNIDEYTSQQQYPNRQEAPPSNTSNNGQNGYFGGAPYAPAYIAQNSFSSSGNPYYGYPPAGTAPNAFTGYNTSAPKNEPAEAERAAGANDATANMERFRKSLDTHFEKSDPFRSNRRDYKWWKVNSPVELNNIFFQCNIKTPLFFNPSVMMAHYKYRYLIVGIYSDKVRRREYIVCGIPGVHGIDERPFGEMCRWVQVEGNRPNYGAFGYWLVYIDPKTGKFLSLK